MRIDDLPRLSACYAVNVLGLALVLAVLVYGLLRYRTREDGNTNQ